MVYERNMMQGERKLGPRKARRVYFERNTHANIMQARHPYVVQSATVAEKERTTSESTQLRDTVKN